MFGVVLNNCGQLAKVGGKLHCIGARFSRKHLAPILLSCGGMMCTLCMHDRLKTQLPRLGVRVLLFRTSVLLALLLLMHVPSKAVGWVTNSGSTPGSIGTAVAVDQRNDDILFAAYIAGPPIQIRIDRYSSTGSLRWSQSVVGDDTAKATGLAVDPTSGDTVVSGSFGTTLDFGSLCGVLTSVGGSDIFLARYASDGTCQWAESFGGSAEDFGNALAIDGSGDIVATGSFTGQMNFGDGVLLGYGGLGPDAFLVKLQANGTLIRSVGFTNPYTSAGQALAIAPSGEIYVTGNFDGTMTLGGVRKTSNAPDIFVARIPADLNLQNCPWWAAFGGMGWDQGYAIALDNGDPIIAGIFGFKITDPIDLGAGLLRIYGTGDGFVAKFAGPNSVAAPEGTCLWSTSFGSYNYDVPYGIAVDSSGNGFLAGQFGPSQGNFPGAAPITGSGLYDDFAAQFDSNQGTFAWARSFGGTGPSDTAMAQALAIDSQGNVVLAGYFSGQVDFCGTTLVSDSYRDFFLASVQPSKCQAGSGGGAPGDCSGNHPVTVDDILVLVNIALGNAGGDGSNGQQVSVDEILAAVNAALSGCGSS